MLLVFDVPQENPKYRGDNMTPKEWAEQVEKFLEPLHDYVVEVKHTNDVHVGEGKYKFSTDTGMVLGDNGLVDWLKKLQEIQTPER